jgi:hypothetical protein
MIFTGAGTIQRTTIGNNLGRIISNVDFSISEDSSDVIVCGKYSLEIADLAYCARASGSFKWRNSS